MTEDTEWSDGLERTEVREKVPDYFGQRAGRYMKKCPSKI